MLAVLEGLHFGNVEEVTGGARALKGDEKLARQGRGTEGGERAG